MTHKPSCMLPSKRSKLLRLAIADLRKAERTEGYAVYMGDWHRQSQVSYDPRTCLRTVERCFVCLAGAVMAFSLNAPPTITLRPDDYPEEIREKLAALNAMRSFDLTDLPRPRPRAKAARVEALIAEYADRDPVSYADNPVKFKREMLKLAGRLERVGL